MDLLILFLALLVAYSFFRSQGGHGLDIKFQPPHVSTPAGKKFWLKASIVISILVAALVLQWAAIPRESRLGLVLLPFLGGAAVYLFSRIKNK